MATQLRHPRSITRLVTVFTTDTTDGLGFTYDLSRGGCRMKSQTPVQRGTYLTLRITLTQYDEPLVVPVARVRWVNGHTLGIVFIRISADCQRRLRRYLATISVRVRI